MYEQLFSIAAANGIWAVLFLSLLCYELTDSRKREQKYQMTIDSLADRLSTVDSIKDSIDNIEALLMVKGVGCELKK